MVDEATNNKNVQQYLFLGMWKPEKTLSHGKEVVESVRNMR